MHLQFGWENEYARTRYAYLQHLIYLRKTKAELEAREEEARRRKNAQFPQSIEDFYSVNREVRMRVVRFLTSDKIGKERMLNEFGWAHLQVKPLVMEYEKNVSHSPSTYVVLWADGRPIARIIYFGRFIIDLENVFARSSRESFCV